MDALLHIVREREEDLCELFAKSREVSVGWLPHNGVKYVESCCKQRLELFWTHGGERGRVVDSIADAIMPGRSLSKEPGGII